MATKASKPITTPTGELALSNVQILNTVRAYAPNDYQQRIPVATQGNISSVLKTMNSYMPNWDVFWNVFVGRIGRTNINDRMNFQNPLAPLKKPALRYGMTIQEVQTNLIKARVYDPNGQNVFGREGREPDIHVAYHTQDRNDDYELNIPMEDVLRGAFIEGESISAFWNSLVSVPIGSAQNDEYLLMRDLTRMYDQLEGFYNINVGDVSDGTLDEQVQAGQKLIWKMRAQYKKMKFFRTEYSPEGRKAGLATRSNRVIAMISADVEAILKVIVQAYAYNESNQDLIADEIIVLDEMPIEGCQALMIDEDWYQCADTLGPLMLQSPLNPQNMSYNYFYHVWQILSYSIFLGAVMFSTRPDTSITALKSTVTGVTLKDAQGQTSSTVPAGDTIQLLAEVQGTNNPNQAVRFEIKAFDGKGAGRALPAECYIDNLGVFHTGNSHAVDKFIISATSLENESFAADYTVTVEGGTYVTAISAENATIAAGTSDTVAVTFTPTDATDQTYEAYSLDTANVVVSNIMPASFTVTSTGVAGTYSVILVAKGSDPSTVDVTKTITVTVNEAS